jgi:hypothetical protein
MQFGCTFTTTHEISEQLTPQTNVDQKEKSCKMTKIEREVVVLTISDLL